MAPLAKVEGYGMVTWIVMAHVVAIVQESPDEFRVCLTGGQVVMVRRSVAESIAAALSK